MPTCRSCGAEIIWCVTESGKRIPVDRAPSKIGNLELVDQGNDPPLAKTASAEAKWKFVSHFATCPHAAKHRKPRDGQGGLPGVA